MSAFRPKSVIALESVGTTAYDPEQILHYFGKLVGQFCCRAYFSPLKTIKDTSMIDRNLMIDALTSDGMFPALLTRGEAEKMSDEELYKKFLELERMEQGKGAYDQQKETHGKFATFVWIAIGIYLFASSDEISLVSWQAAIFLFFGMFAAALVFGVLGYVIQRGIAKMLVTTISGPPTGAAASAIGVLGLVLMALEAVLIFYVARFVFNFFV